MASTSKFCYLSKELNVKLDEDRISNLPDNLICHILSFLPTKYAVATSVLSTKWKDLWTFTNSLEFDDGLLRDDRTSTSPHLQTSFRNFVDRVLLLCRSSCLRKFHFECSYGYDVCHVNAWIASVLEHNIQELFLNLPMKEYASLPGNLFTCKTLVELKLGTGFVMNIAESVWLPCLKVLDIETVKFLNEDSIIGLLSGCPLLEKLSLSTCIGEGVQVLNICAPVLRSLDLHWVACWNEDPPFTEYKIVLDTPMLCNLIIEDFVFECYEFKNLNHLKKAHIALETACSSQNFCPGDIYCKPVDDIFEAVCGVQILRLSGSSMEAIDSYQSRLPIFHHMTTLILRWNGCVDWRVLPLLLEKSPHLRTLTLLDGLQVLGSDGNPCSCRLDENMFHDETCYLNYFCPRETVPNCLHFHLKKIELGYFHDLDEEIRIIGYFLKNALVLEKLTVHPGYSSEFEDLDVISKKLLKLPRASNCQIEFCDFSIWDVRRES